MGAPREAGSARRLGVFAAEPHALQVAWASMRAGVACFRAGDAEVEVDTDGGPGTVVLEPLPAGSSVKVRVTGDGLGRGGRRLGTRTLHPPPGRLLARVATIGDLHVGEVGFGFRGHIKEPRVPVPYTVRSAQAAADEAAAWGAELLVVKGDVTHRGRAAEWAAAEEVLSAAPVPVLALPGNHDVKPGHDVAPSSALRTVTMVRDVTHVDLPATRLVLVDTTRSGQHHGDVDRTLDAVTDTLAEARRDRRGALVMLHHQLQRGPMRAFWPPGIGRRESVRFLDSVAAANPNTLVTAGHTHRHRSWRHGPVACTTVGSVKDYPGVWAGYAIYEGGVVQTVRRVARPDVIRWTERSGATMGGAYRHWTPGRLSSRCFTLVWDRREGAGVTPG